MKLWQLWHAMATMAAMRFAGESWWSQCSTPQYQTSKDTSWAEIRQDVWNIRWNEFKKPFNLCPVPSVWSKRFKKHFFHIYDTSWIPDDSCASDMHLTAQRHSRSQQLRSGRQRGRTVAATSQRAPPQQRPLRAHHQIPFRLAMARACWQGERELTHFIVIINMRTLMPQLSHKQLSTMVQKNIRHQSWSHEKCIVLRFIGR